MKKDISLRQDKRERTFAKWLILLLTCVLTVTYLIIPPTVFGELCSEDGVTLSPLSTTLAVGETHQLDATYCERGWIMTGVKIDFEIEGQNSSSSGSAITDAITGIASFTYQGNQEGVDKITASYYSVESEEATATWTQKSPDIEIETAPTKLNVNSQGVLPMIVYGSADFDVQTIDPSSLRLNGAVSPKMYAYEDAGSKSSGDPDGFLDLTLKFDLQEIVETLGDTPGDGETVTLVLTGSLYNTVTATQTARTATTIRAEQDVEIMNKGKRKKGK
jgi:hypothetical protein